MPNTRNQFDTRDCLERGESAEQQFARLAATRGYRVSASAGQQDIDEHWDLLIAKPGETYRVDIKAMKRIARSDARAQDNWVWIELHSVRTDDIGWLFGGKADWIAFERAASFVIVPRAALVALIPKIVDRKSRVTKPADAKYKLYQRANRPDLLTLVEMTQLDKIKIAEWQKQKSKG
ncbi:MAG: hypothetical protein L0Y55_03845 [Anaerolineales bacterium]|nr:hypothetical protein [Anaerolineales bacterium]